MNLVTGGTGFLGAYIIRHLLHQGERVRATKRPTSKMDLVSTFEDQVEWVDADLLDVFSISDAMEDVTHVYHSAAMVSFDPKDKYDMLRTNVQGTANVVNSCLAANVTKLLHVSSNAALGREINGQVIDEETNWNTSKYNSNYALSKHESELEVWRGIAEGLNAAIINPSLILGSGYWNEGTTGFFHRIDQGLKFIPAGASGFVDVRDVAQLAYQLMQSDISGERFIVNAENRSFEDFFKLIAQEVQVAGPSIKAKSWMVEFAWRMEKLKCLISGHKPMITEETATNSMNTFYYQNAKIKDGLNYTFYPLEKTIRETAEQYMNAKKNGSHWSMLPELAS